MYTHAQNYRALNFVLVLAACLPAHADVFAPLCSYEPAESDLTVTANAGDPGLSIAIVPGGVNGAPPATDGAYLLKITISNESDRKVEFRHDWNSTWYDLTGATELLADIYLAGSGARPGVMGVYSDNWSPPSPWQPVSTLPSAIGAWTTVSFPLNGRIAANLDYLHAIVLENLAGTSGVAYFDNLRFRRPGAPPAPTGLAANGHADHNLVAWKPTRLQQLDGYHVYRAAAAAGPFTRVTAAPLSSAAYHDTTAPAAARSYYRVTVQIAGVESPQSAIASAQFDGLSDEQLMDLAQQSSLGYFWDAAHPYCGMAREGIGFGHPAETVTVGGTGFGLMTIVVGAERGFVTRAAAAVRVRKILRFLDGANPFNPALSSNVQRYHGAWAHHYHGTSGATIPFAGAADNGGDLVETAFLVQGLLTVRQYFDSPTDAAEIEIRSRATSMWEGVEWDWYRQHPGSNLLYWNWSPDYGWQINLAIQGFNEAKIIYILAAASPTHPMPPESYRLGWEGLPWFANGRVYFGRKQWLGEPMGGPLFFTHYSDLGFDPRYRHDTFCNHFRNARNISLIQQAYCTENRYAFAAYCPLVWGLTASADASGYAVHSPLGDNGTLTPTAALSAMPYTPRESLATLRHLYDEYGTTLFGPYGFYDAFNPTLNWTGAGYLAIDQGTIAPMIENCRSGLCWRLFMSNAEIRSAVRAIGFVSDVDFDADQDVDATDLGVFLSCIAGPAVITPAPPATPAQFDAADLDYDGDVDVADAAIFQRLYGAE
ncbi:MAG: glucoamylase family protein [Phycisphaerae bacterium]